MSILADIGTLLESVTTGVRAQAPSKYDESDHLPDIIREFNEARGKTYEAEFEEHWARLEEERLAGAAGKSGMTNEEPTTSHQVEKTGFVKNLYTEDPFTGQRWGIIESAPEAEKPPNPFAKVDKETEYLRNEMANRDRFSFLSHMRMHALTNTLWSRI
jgi:hypothetical protein